MTFAGSIPTSSTSRSPAASATPSWRSPVGAACSSGRDARPSSEPLVAAFIEGALLAGRRRRRPRAGVHRPRATSRPAPSTRRPRCSPPATTRRSTTASSCAGRARCPIGQDTGLAEIKAMVAGGLLERAEEPGRVERRDLLPAFVAHVHSFVDLDALAPAAGGRRHRQRRRRPHRARGVRRPPVRPHPPLRRARRHVPEPPRRPDPAREPEGPPARGARRRRRRRPRVRRRRRPRLPRRRPGAAGVRVHHHRDAGRRHPRRGTRARRSCTT